MDKQRVTSASLSGDDDDGDAAEVISCRASSILGGVHLLSVSKLWRRQQQQRQQQRRQRRQRRLSNLM
jgi:hypothetical protein